MNATSPVGSVAGGFGKGSRTGCVTGSICGEIRRRPVSTFSSKSHHSGWFSKSGLVTPAMYPGLD